MIASLLLVWAVNSGLITDNGFVFFELFGIYAFAAYWVVKTFEMPADHPLSALSQA